MISTRMRRHRAIVAVAARERDAPVWQDAWSEAAARYRRGELSDAECDRLLEVMP